MTFTTLNRDQLVGKVGEFFLNADFFADTSHDGLCVHCGEFGKVAHSRSRNEGCANCGENAVFAMDLVQTIL